MHAEPESQPGVHPQALLLPWFLAGTLSEFEREAVSAHLATCSACRQELEAVHDSRRLVRDGLAAAARPPVELEQRVIQAINAAPPARAPAIARAGGGRSAGFGWRIAAGLALATMGGEALVIAHLAGSAPVAAPAASRGLAPEALHARLLLAPAAAEAEVRALLLRLHVRIVDGPDAGGVYVIAIDPLPGAAPDARLATLEAATAIVRDVRLAP